MGKHPQAQENIYPKVKVRVEEEEAGQYEYESTSLQSLKAFEWLSLNQASSSDDSPMSVVRIPRTYITKTPPPRFLTSKEETDKKNESAEDKTKIGKAYSAPRPRAVLSSPYNDGILGSKVQPRKLFSGQKNNNPCPNRVTPYKTCSKSQATEDGKGIFSVRNQCQDRDRQCKTFPKSVASEEGVGCKPECKKKPGRAEEKSGTKPGDFSARVGRNHASRVK